MTNNTGSETGLVHTNAGLWQRIDWSFVRQHTASVFAAAAALITLMYVAAISTAGPSQVGALNVLIWALMRALPIALGVTLLAALVLALWSLRRQR